MINFSRDIIYKVCNNFMFSSVIVNYLNIIRLLFTYNCKKNLMIPFFKLNLFTLWEMRNLLLNFMKIYRIFSVNDDSAFKDSIGSEICFNEASPV